MKKFVENKKLITAIAVIIIVILIIVYTYFYSPDYEYITEESFFNETILETTETNEFKTEEILEKNLISVHIAGSVKKEGVIQIEESSRLIDAIEKAGGLTEKADLSNVNLAYEIKDGQKIYIPNKKDEENKGIIMTEMPNYIIPKEETTTESGTLIININNATQTELEQLPGIGPSIASSIINYRKEKGNFKNIEEIKNVEGIGQAKYNKIKNYICI